MGNFFGYYDLVREYDDIILNVNSFAPTDKKLNYVIFKSITNDDDEDNEDSSEERETYIEKFYSRYNH
jgi:hypothetical protein